MVRNHILHFLILHEVLNMANSGIAQEWLGDFIGHCLEETMFKESHLKNHPVLYLNSDLTS